MVEEATSIWTVLGAVGALGVGGFVGSYAAHRLRERADGKREERERDGVLRLLLAEIKHNVEVVNTAQQDRPGLVGSPNLSYMKTETWRATRVRSTQLVPRELLGCLEDYYTPLETLLTLLKFEGPQRKSAGDRWLRAALAERFGEEQVALDPPVRYAMRTLDAQRRAKDQITEYLGLDQDH